MSRESQGSVMKRRNVIRTTKDKRTTKKKGETKTRCNGTHLIHLTHANANKKIQIQQKHKIEALSVRCMKWQSTYAYFANAKLSNNNNNYKNNDEIRDDWHVQHPWNAATWLFLLTTTTKKPQQTKVKQRRKATKEVHTRGRVEEWARASKASADC